MEKPSAIASADILLIIKLKKSNKNQQKTNVKRKMNGAARLQRNNISSMLVTITPPFGCTYHELWNKELKLESFCK